MNIDKSSHTTKWIAVKDLDVRWAQAQRPFNQKWAENIRDNLDPDVFGVLSVTLPNGNGCHHVIDGQHRKWAVSDLWGPNEMVPCNICNADTPERAAEIFNAMNTARKKPFPLDVFKVRVTAKIEPEFSVNKTAESIGFKIGNSPEDGYIRGCGACVAVYRKYGKDTFIDALLTIRRCWGLSTAGMNASLIRGFGDFLSRYGKDVDRVKFAEKISKNYTPSRLLGAAKGAQDLFRGSVAGNISRVLLNTHNQGIRTGRLGEKKRA